ncbi:unnamed protein product, partial [Urochloa humidicola]
HSTSPSSTPFWARRRLPPRDCRLPPRLRVPGSAVVASPVAAAAQTGQEEASRQPVVIFPAAVRQSKLRKGGAGGLHAGRQAFRSSDTALKKKSLPLPSPALRHRPCKGILAQKRRKVRRSRAELQFLAPAPRNRSSQRFFRGSTAGAVLHQPVWEGSSRSRWW